MTLRCPYCGKMMEIVRLGDERLLQCPKCKYVKPVPPEEQTQAAQD